MKSLRLVAVSVLVALTLRAGADATPAQSDLAALLTATDDVAAKVSKLRGLPIRRPIDRGVMGKPDVTRRLIERLAEEYSDTELVEEGRAFTRLGLLAAGTDYKQLVLDLLTEQIGGFYDPKEKKLYIADWIEAWMQGPVMAHEIDHALQDQSFNLDAFMKPVKENSDEQVARQALVEGDGFALMLQYTFREQGYKFDPWGNSSIVDIMRQTVAQGGLGGDAMGRLAKAPLVLREQLIFPYLAGFGLMADTLRHNPWARIDDMFRKPPVSSEQVLHPDKYFASEKPVPLRSPVLPSLKGWQATYRNVLGELGWSILFRQHGVDGERARTAAAGWGGDRLVVYAPAGDDGKSIADLVAIDVSSWDAEADALEAFGAASDALVTLTGATTASERTATYVSASDATGDVSFVEQKGSRMVLVIGAPAATAARLRADAWAKWKVGSQPPTAGPGRRKR